MSEKYMLHFLCNYFWRPWTWIGNNLRLRRGTKLNLDHKYLFHSFPKLIRLIWLIKNNCILGSVYMTTIRAFKIMEAIKIHQYHNSIMSQITMSKILELEYVLLDYVTQHLPWTIVDNPRIMKHYSMNWFLRV